MKLKIFTIKDIAEMIERRIANNFDARIVVDGVTGIGKSTFIWKLCRKTKRGLVLFKPKRDIIYSRDDAIKHLANKIKGIIWNDEMINVGYKRDFYDDGQKKLVKGLNMYRDSFNVFFMAVPEFSDLDTDIRDLCSMRITIIKRGVGLIQLPKVTLYSPDKWDMKYNQKMENEWANSKSSRPRYGSLSTAVGLVYFGDMSPQQRALYNAIKKEKRNKVFGNQLDEGLMGDPEKLFYDKLIDLMRKGKLTPDAFETACVVNGKDYLTIRRNLNRRLTSEGDTNKVKDYILSGKRKEKKDLLGFTLPYLDETQTNTEIKKERGLEVVDKKKVREWGYEE